MQARISISKLLVMKYFKTYQPVIEAFVDETSIAL